MKTKIQIHKVAKNLNQKIRIQDYAVGIFDLAYTKSALKKVLKKGYITIDGVKATTANFIIGGEIIEARIPTEKRNFKKLNLNLEVLYEDEYIALINKPAGILVSGNSFKTITNALSSNLKPSKKNDSCIPQPVHRLDYGTTGVLLIGKTYSAIRALNNLFEFKRIKKTYLAITIGQMKENTQTIKIPIENKAAISQYELMDYQVSEKYKQLNLVKLNPITGKRHQLRKHLAYIGNPILGDQDYGIEGKILLRHGIYLHAHSIKFQHPFTQEDVIIKAKIPIKFTNIFPKLDIKT